MSMSENQFKEELEEVEHAIIKLVLCLRELNENNLISSHMLKSYEYSLMESFVYFKTVLNVCNDGLQEMN